MVAEDFEPKSLKHIISHDTLFRTRCERSHFGLSISLPVIFLLSVCLLAACWIGCQTVSLDEARDISIEFSDVSFEPPPRLINDVVSEHCENFEIFGTIIPLLSLNGKHIDFFTHYTPWE